MKGDFSRSTFEKKKNYSSVLKQQGRVSLDADWNELCDIVAHHRRSRTKDIVGVIGTHIHDGGFKVHHLIGESDLLISPGRIYANGLLCELHPTDKIQILGFPAGTSKRVQLERLDFDKEEILKNPRVAIFSKQKPDGTIFEIDTSILSDSNDSKTILSERVLPLKQSEAKNVKDLFGGDTSLSLHWMLSYSQQPHYPDVPLFTPENEETDLVFLDVWERHITANEDPDIREIALGGPDTTTRTETVWQVRLLRIEENVNCLDFKREIEKEFPPSRGFLKACTEPPEDDNDLCLQAQGGGYRGLRNRLYRVEIHESGNIETATFKWSRNNGSVVHKIEEFIQDDSSECTRIRLERLGRDQVLRIKKGSYLEVSEDVTDLNVEAFGTMVKVLEVDETDNILTLSADVSKHNKGEDSHPKVRRWDTGEKTGNGVTQTSEEEIVLERGVKISFGGSYLKTGDYWIFAARASTGEIEELDFEPPMGIKHYYCPLAIVTWGKQGDLWVADVRDCRPKFPSVTELTNMFYVSGDGQEAIPGDQLPGPLRVRVANGKWPVPEATVEFKIVSNSGDGSLVEGSKGANPTFSNDSRVMTVETDSDGLADCCWNLDNEPDNQQVEATLLDDAGIPVHAPILFNANLSKASAVHYDPKDCSLLEGKENVQDAIYELCRKAGGEGCAVTVGTGGRYETLKEASDALNEDNDICICLMPGIHLVDESIEMKDKNTIKIVGCGSRINLTSEEIALTANKISLLDIELLVENELGKICLSGDNVSAERCSFIRKIGTADTGPLVLIERKWTGEGERGNTLHWKHNRMVSSWEEFIQLKMKDYFVPIEGIQFTDDSQAHLADLLEARPDVDPDAFVQSVEAVVQDVNALSQNQRTAWINNRPTQIIDTLEDEPKAAINEFFNYLNRTKHTNITVQTLQKKIEAIFWAFHALRHNVALALEYGVGGWIEDNFIDGYVVLRYYGPKTNYLCWDKTALAPEKERISTEFLLNLSEDSGTLALRGNKIRAVYSNGYSIMQVIHWIIGDPDYDWGLPLKEKGYRSLNVEENVFLSNESSFISESLVMKGNHFAGATAETDIPAYILGYGGLFVGNVVPYKMMADGSAIHSKIEVETILKPNWKSVGANLLRIG